MSPCLSSSGSSRMTNKNLKPLAAGALIVLATCAHAQVAYVRPAYQFPAPPLTSGPASIQLGESPLFVAPFVGVAAGYDDNLFLSPSNEKSSTIYLVSPGF